MSAVNGVARVMGALALALVGLEALAAGALGASAAIDARGVLWVVHREGSDQSAHIVALSSRDEGKTWSAPVRINPRGEPVSADGENRPKIAVGAAGELYASWSSPTSAKYTADVRFARSLDNGRTWSTPQTVHRDRQVITHRFDSLIVDRDGRIWVVWIDKRDLERAKEAAMAYVGAAVYYAYSEDRGESWRGDFKLADHSCECCRIAVALNDAGAPVVFWRHVFEGGERDHALAVLRPDEAPRVQRATFDRWRIDACPHHGPALAFDRAGAAHAVWFNNVEGQGRVFYGRLRDGEPTQVQALPSGAEHADIGVSGEQVAIAWKRFDGARTRVETWLSRDAGRTFVSGPTLDTNAASDQPRVLNGRDGLMLIWRRAEDIAVQALIAERDAARVSSTPTEVEALNSRAEILPFDAQTMPKIEQTHAGKRFWLVLWDLECGYCMQSLRNLARAQQRDPSLQAVTLATDSIDESDELVRRLAELGVRSEAYAFANGSPESLRYAVDPNWLGEKPRAYRYTAAGRAEAVTGVVSVEGYLE